MENLLKDYIYKNRVNFFLIEIHPINIRMVMKLERKTKVVTLITLNTIMFAAEITIGYMTGSLALVADSFHMISDILALSIALYAISLAKKKPRSTQHTYGFSRAEIVGALVNSTFLLALAFSIILSSIQRFIDPVPVTAAFLVFCIGWAGLAVNVFGLFLFHEHSDGNSQGMMNMQGVFLHVLGDALGSVGVIVSASVINWTNWNGRFYMDPALSLLIALIIITTTTPLFRKTANVVLHVAPPFAQVEELRKDISSLENVENVHEFHIWQLSDSKTVATIHIVVSSNTRSERSEEIVSEIKDILHSNKVHSTTVQVEKRPLRLENVEEGGNSTEIVINVEDDIDYNSCYNRCID